MSDLKPCPFCGTKDNLCPSAELSCDDQIINGVSCYGCGMEVSLWQENAEKDYALWNTRPAEAALQKRVEELEAKVKRVEDALDSETESQRWNSQHIRHALSWGWLGSRSTCG